MSRNHTSTSGIIKALRCTALMLLFVLFGLLNSTFPGVGEKVGSHLEDFGEQVSDFVGLDHYQIDNHFSFVKAKASQYRKKYKHLNDSGLDLQPFGKRLTQNYTVPYSLTGYQQPHISCAQHGFLYRLTYF
ncbi:hypothetical protein [Pedobacter frigidisoli]|uniref:hypothetical protein n=1 Tax=Pedobacter frigidisoli TaxID=2530455 RepID=UPI00292D0CD5|nr:hypothetical protein [Pedobacter frigidisoli]